MYKHENEILHDSLDNKKKNHLFHQKFSSLYEKSSRLNIFFAVTANTRWQHHHHHQRYYYDNYYISKILLIP